MITIINTRVGQNKTGLRIWSEGKKLAHAIRPGQLMSVDKDPVRRKLKLQVIESEAANDSFVKVSKRTKNGIVQPLFEITDEFIDGVFALGMLLKISVSKTAIFIEEHVVEAKKRERTTRIKEKFERGEALTFGSLCLGGGVLDRSLHDGLKASGVDSYCKFAVEKESQYLDIAAQNNSSLFRDDSILIHSDMTLVSLDNPVCVDAIVAGLMCTGASRAGVSKNKLEKPEDHKDAGHLFVPFLNFVDACNPYLILLENVPEYEKSAAFSVIEKMLVMRGYRLSWATLNGNVFGCLEDRDRLCLIAMSEHPSAESTEDNPFDFGLLTSHFDKEDTVSEVLDDIPEDSERYKEYAYLAEKEIRDKKAGKGFRRNLYFGNESKVNTLRRHYAKGGSCEQYLVHPRNKELSRLFTPTEHARFKRVPLDLIEGLSETVAHQILGQGVCYSKFYSVGYGIGELLTKRFTYSRMKEAA